LWESVLSVKLFERREVRTLGSDLAGGDITCTEDRAELHVPICGNAGEPCAILIVSYDRADPFVFLLHVCSLSGRPIIERYALRSDIRKALTSPGCLPGLSIGPASRDGETALVFEEGRVTLPVVVPTEPLLDLISASDRVVGMTPENETAALNDAYAMFLSRYASAGLER
jgi:hypothetical protein